MTRAPRSHDEANGRSAAGREALRLDAGWRRLLPLAALLIGVIALWQAPAHAAACADASAITRPETLPRLDAHAAARGWSVLAIGSSSTFGTGATSPLHAYPARLEALLRARAPHGDVTVVNAGVPGETADGTLDRLADRLAAQRFDLVIWQVGTNDALRGVPEADLAARLDRGVATVRDAGIPLLLVDPQYFPGIPDRAAYERTVRRVGDLAGARGVAVLRRYDVMRAWAERADDRLAAMLADDRFHMSDAGYACLAELIAAALVAEDAPRPADRAAAGRHLPLLERGDRPPFPRVSPASGRSGALPRGYRGGSSRKPCDRDAPPRSRGGPRSRRREARRRPEPAVRRPPDREDIGETGESRRGAPVQRADRQRTSSRACRRCRPCRRGSRFKGARWGCSLAARPLAHRRREGRRQRP